MRHHAEALSNSEDQCGRLEGQLEQALADCGEKDELLLALREEVVALKDNLRALDTQGSRLHAERDAPRLVQAAELAVPVPSETRGSNVT